MWLRGKTLLLVKRNLLLAKDDALRVGEEGIDSVAIWAFDVHEKWIWCLNLSLKFVNTSFHGGVGVK